MYTLYYAPGLANMAPHIMLEEIGAKYELHRIDTAAGEHKEAAYLKLNPVGLIPVLVDGDLVISETAAICLHLADRHPEANLAPPVGSDARARFYRWLCYFTNTVQVGVLMFYYAGRYTEDPAGADAVKASADRRLRDMFTLIDGELAGRQYFLDDAFGVLDTYLFTLCRFARPISVPPREMTNLGPYLENLIRRPSVARMLEQEGLQAPYV